MPTHTRTIVLCRKRDALRRKRDAACFAYTTVADMVAAFRIAPPAVQSLMNSTQITRAKDILWSAYVEASRAFNAAKVR